jgi:glycosyltransferase involved in cell wall biosynthesis
VRRAIRQLGFRNLISWFVVPHPGALARHLGERLTVYYCIDDYAAFPGVDAEAIRAMDDALTRAADVVFVASPALLNAKRACNSEVHFSPHGVDVGMFAQASDPSTEPAEAARELRHPVIGYFGSLGEWIDYDLLLFLARSRPQWTFLLVGYASADLGELKNCVNVAFAGPQPYETLPRWAKAFDVAVIPYRLTRQVKNANPLKLREYLATGKPVVSVTTPETARFASVVNLADTPETYLSAIETALEKDTEDARRRRLETVAPLSWDARFQETMAVVEQLLSRQRDEVMR